MHKKICTGRWQQAAKNSNSDLQYGLQSRFSSSRVNTSTLNILSLRKGLCVQNRWNTQIKRAFLPSGWKCFNFNVKPQWCSKAKAYQLWDFHHALEDTLIVPVCGFFKLYDFAFFMYNRVCTFHEYNKGRKTILLCICSTMHTKDISHTCVRERE